MQRAKEPEHTKGRVGFFGGFVKYYLDSGFVIALATIAWLAIQVVKCELMPMPKAPAVPGYKNARSALNATMDPKLLQVLCSAMRAP